MAAFLLTSSSAGAEERREFRFGPSDALAGEIILPKADPSTPLAVFLPPAGDIDRHGSSETFTTFAGEYDRYARAVLDAGWGIVRYDKGGTGASAGADASERVASDHRIAAFGAALSQTGLDPSALAIVAQSTATWTVASRAEEIRKQAAGKPLVWILLSNLTGPSTVKVLTGDLLVVVGSGDAKADAPTAGGMTDAHRAAFPSAKTRLLYLEGYDHALCTLPPGKKQLTMIELAARWRGKPGSCGTPARVYEEITGFLRR